MPRRAHFYQLAIEILRVPSKFNFWVFYLFLLILFILPSACFAAALATWHLDENTGVEARDSSLNHYDLNWYYNPWGDGQFSPVRSPGKWDLGIQFNQTEQLFSRSFSPALEFTQGLTVGIWFKTSLNTPEYARFFWAGNTFNYAGNPANNFFLAVKDGLTYLRLTQNNSTQAELGSFRRIDDGNWHLATAVFDSNNSDFYLYLDGELQSRAALNAPIPSMAQVVLGRRENYFASYRTSNFSGILDDVWIEDSPLTGSEINDIFLSPHPYQTQINSPAPVPAQVLAHYRFDDSDSVATDVSSHHYDMSWNSNFWGGGASTPRWTGGKFGSAANFHKVEDNFSTYLPSISLDHGLTLGAWIKTSAQSLQLSRILVTGNNNNNRPANLMLAEQNGHIVARLFYTDDVSGQFSFTRTYQAVSSQPWNDNNWHQVAVVMDSRPSAHIFKLYIDGKPDQSAFFPDPLPQLNYLTIGFRETNICGSECNYQGDIDDLFFLDSIVSDQDIKNIYESGQPLIWPIVPKHNPVIIVPGIMGSDLINATNPDDKIWLDVERTMGSWSDDFLNLLEMNNNGNSINVLNVGDVIKEIKALKVYNQEVLIGLINYLKSNGYQENNDLFVFPYDWRQDISLTSVQLNQKIQDIVSKPGFEKVDVIAHSMGGLVVKDYMHEHVNQNMIDKFVDISTPHFGAPKTFKTLKFGDDFDFHLGGLVFLNQNEIKIISQNMPSVYELLPSARYYDPGHIDYNFIYSDQGHNYDYDDTNSYLKIWNNPILVDKAKALHNEIDDYNSYSGNTRTYNIIGCGFATIGKITVLNKEKDHNEYRINYISGDGTVPLKSAEGIAAYKTYYHDGTEHMSIPSANGVPQLVNSILDGKESSFDLSPYPMSISSNICQIRGKVVSYHSPIALHAYDENSNHVGPDANDDIENKIPGAQYDVIDDNKFLFLPAGRTYKIVGRATGLGTFNSRVETIVDGQVTQTAYFNQVPITTINTNVEMTVSDNQINYDMKVDQDGDHTFESTAQPASILNAQESADLVKPETNINITGNQGNNNWYTSSVLITFTATDNDGGSGILKIEYSLDDGHTWQSYNGVITVDKQGTSKIIFKSTDRAGNVEEEKISEFKIDSIAPTSSSIIIGTIGQNDWYTSDVQISLLAEDSADGSGLNRMEYSTDNGNTWQSYSQVIALQSDCKSNIIYRAIDNAGNMADNKVISVKIDQTPPTLDMIAPLANDKYDHAENLEILYNISDDISGLNEKATKLQIDDQNISTTSIDLFPYHLGVYKLTVNTADMAGNQVAITVPFAIITSIPGAVDDIKRLYTEKQITKVDARDNLIKDLDNLQKYLERYGVLQKKILSKYQERLNKCDKKKKHVSECKASIKKIYERQEYALTKSYAKVVANKFTDILNDLDKFYGKKWLMLDAYDLIKEELIYFKSYL